MAKIGDILDISGETFSYLKAVSFAYRKLFPSGQSHNMWNCECCCGTAVVVSLGQLRGGRKKSCGCMSSTLIATARTVHGYRKGGEPTNKTWLCWVNMKSRCDNPSNARFSQYGGRGIRVCKAWYEFTAFLADMGDCPDGFSLERINVNEGYSPENCKWIPLIDQFENMQKSIRITYREKTQSLKRWSVELGLNYGTLYSRYKRGDRGNALFRKPREK